MKSLYTLLFLFATAICSAQQNRLYMETDIRGRGCIGGIGICSTEPANPEQANSLFYKSSENTLTMEIFREHISREEEIRLFGEAITPENKDELSFQQPETFVLEPSFKEQLGIDESTEGISAGEYPAKIDETKIVVWLSIR